MSKISKKLDAEVRLESKNRCGYCLGEQRYILAWLEIEHLYPRSLGGKVRQRKFVAGMHTFKSSQTHSIDPKTKRKVTLFNPRTQIWKKHFEFDSDKITILGKTVCGRATVEALQMNYELALDTRKLWVGVGWYPPKD